MFLFVCFLFASGSPAHGAEQPRTILVVGDSISAAYGMSLEEGWVALLQLQLDENHPHHRVINASISGETSAGAATRLPGLLQEHQPALVVIELGGNDGLRGYPIKRLRANLQQMTQQAKDSGADVVLLGMEIPPNYGSRYTQQFREAFQTVAETTNSALVPFFLDGVATDSTLMQQDGIHPRPEAQALLLANAWPTLELLLQPTDSKTPVKQEQP